jgi:hypothetical protein
VLPWAGWLILIPTRRRLTKSATDKVAAHMVFKQLLDEFIEDCQLGNIKMIFSKCVPNVFHIGPSMSLIKDNHIRITDITSTLTRAPEFMTDLT